MHRRSDGRFPRSSVLILTAIALLATGCARRYDAAFDFDGDRKADLITMAVNASGSFWIRAPEPLTVIFNGDALAEPVAGDYDGDGRWEIAELHSNGDWVTQGDAGTMSFPKPSPTLAGDKYVIYPVAAAYDGANKTLPAWYRDSDATWFIYGHDPIQFGSGPTNTSGTPAGCCLDNIDQDMPVPADYDGDTKADLATFNPRTGLWRIRSSKDGTVRTITLGGPATLPVPANYDGGRRAQPAVYTWAGNWIIEGATTPIKFGSGISGLLPAGDDFPMPADYDGDGKADLAVGASHDGRRTASWNIRGAPAPIPTAGIPIELNLNLGKANARLTLLCRNLGPTCPPQP